MILYSVRGFALRSRSEIQISLGPEAVGTVGIRSRTLSLQPGKRAEA